MLLDSGGYNASCGEGIGTSMTAGGGTGATNLFPEFLGEFCDLSLEPLCVLLVEGCRREYGGGSST